MIARRLGVGRVFVCLEGPFFGLGRLLTMKMMRLALFFGVGIYLGLKADSLGDLEAVAQTIRDLIEHARRFR